MPTVCAFVAVRPTLTSLVGALGMAAAAAAGPVTPEVEPNDAKTTATAVGPMASGDSFTGTSTATSGAGLDYFSVQTAAAAPAVYRHQLTLTSTGTVAHTMTLRGLTQSTGVIAAGSDATFQTGAILSSPARRLVQWYGFGHGERVYCRVTGNGSTTQPYTATLTSVEIPVVSLGASLSSGEITISTANAGAPDTDIWLYDSQFNAIAGAGNDDEFGTSNPTSRLTRTLAPGMYTLAVGRFNVANNLPSPSDDDSRSSSVLDFADALASSSVNPGSSATFAVSFEDGVGPTRMADVTLPQGVVGEIAFVQFVVEGAAVPMGAGGSIPSPVPQGGSATLTISVTPAAGSTLDNITSVTADVSAVSGNPANTSVAFSRNAMSDTWIYNVPIVGGSIGNQAVTFVINDSGAAAAGVGNFTVSVVPPPPANDTCFGATPLVLGQVSQGSTINALTNDGSTPPSGCSQGGSNKGVWFAFTPASTGNYRVSACGSAFDTVLSVFSVGTCADPGTWTLLACDDDACDGISPIGSTLASEIASVALQAGTEYRIRLAGWGPESAGLYAVRVSAAVSPGACCTGGCCAVTTMAACGGVWTDGAVCTPVNPCPAPANDSCDDATELEEGVVLTGDNCSATSAGDGPSSSCASGSLGVWFRFVPAASAAYTISSCGSAIDSVLTVYSGSCDSLGSLACNDQATCGGAGSPLAASLSGQILQAGLPYLVRLQSFGASGFGGAYSIVVMPDSATGACCTSVGCAITDEPRCTGDFDAMNTCSPSPCPVGACCSGSTCIMVSPDLCAGPNTRFDGGAACNSPGNYGTPCCIADFNQSGGATPVTVQDVFDFLGAFFSNDPQADISGSGVSVQDVFDFLSAFFSGSC